MIDQKMEKIVLGFLDFVHSECRVIENAYRCGRRAFTARASWFLYRTAEKAGFLLSAHPTAIDGGISSMPFTQEQLLGEIRDVGVRSQGHAWLRGNDAAAIDWVAQQAMAIVTGTTDITACYRNGFFTGTFRSLLASLIRAYEQNMKR